MTTAPPPQQPPGTPPVVYIVDDDAATLEALAGMVRESGYTPVTFGSGTEFLDEAPDSGSACLLLDYHMQGLGGLDTLLELRRRNITLPTIMMNGRDNVRLAVQAMKLGAFDFIEKPHDTRALQESLREACARSRELHEKSEERLRAQAAVEALTPRERDVFNLLILGASTKEAARELGLSPRTVDVYRAGLYQKTGSSGIADLVRLAFHAGILD